MRTIKRTSSKRTEKAEFSRAQRLAMRARRRLIILSSVGAAALVLAIATVIYFWPKAITHPDEIGVRRLYSYQTVARYLGMNQEQFKPWFEQTGQKTFIQLPPAEIKPTEPVVTAPTNNGDIITFVVFGLDDGNGNTDVIMVCALDTTNYTFNVVSIPRDTLCNLSTKNRKANIIYYNKGGSEDKIDRAKRILQRDFRNLLGYEPDFFVTVNISVFKKLINAIGGVDFEVPRNMNYEDPAQDLYIHLAKGKQHLNGDQAIQLVRYRSGYGDADIGRIKTTQSFLMEAAKQILAKKSSVPLTTIIDVFFNDVRSASHETDYGSLTMNYYTWLAAELLKVSAENISFTLMPGNYNDLINNESYVTIYVEDWIEVIREKLGHEVTSADLSILTRNSGKQLYVTDGNWVGSVWR